MRTLSLPDEYKAVGPIDSVDYPKRIYWALERTTGRESSIDVLRLYDDGRIVYYRDSEKGTKLPDYETAARWVEALAQLGEL